MAFIKLLKRKRDNVPTERKGKYQEIYQDKRWKLLRSTKLKANPLCERCEHHNKVTPTKEVHHIIPFDYGRTPEEIEELAFDFDNLKSVCNECHDEEHKILIKNDIRNQWMRVRDNILKRGVSTLIHPGSEVDNQ